MNEMGIFTNKWCINYTQQELANMAETIYDCIPIEERRLHGYFNVPTKILDFCKGKMNEVFGKNWMDEYAVWDIDCKMGDMILGLSCKNGLYCSSFDSANIDVVKCLQPKANAFVFDFLNDDLERLEPTLLNLIKSGKKKIMVFSNPAFATASGNRGKSKGKSSCSSLIGDMMNCANMDAAAKNKMAQVLYRIMLIKEKYGVNISMAFFAPPVFMSSTSYKNFRLKFLNHFTFEGAIGCNASHFGCDDSWGISFSMWKSI